MKIHGRWITQADKPLSFRCWSHTTTNQTMTASMYRPATLMKKTLTWIMTIASTVLEKAAGQCDLTTIGSRAILSGA